MKKLEKTYLIMPIDESEDYAVSDMYALYTSDRGIEIGILDPELILDLPLLANISGMKDADDIALFVDAKDGVDDRPVYKIYPELNRTVGVYEVVTGDYVPLIDVVKGKYKVKPSKEDDVISSDKTL